MKTTLKFRTYLHLSGFMAVTENSNLQMDLRTKCLTAVFSETEIKQAILLFNARLETALSD